MPREHSAGGVIFENSQVLLILMLNLEGRKVWTFPKGHIEPGETSEAAAVREVAEETGFDCEITGELYKAEYSFVRNGVMTDKDVRWYMMKRMGGDGMPKTPDEVLDLKWFPLDEAGQTLTYMSDLAILELLRSYEVSKYDRP
jgi:8-oxo-dGTP pyrophosphatase MutT (NUDIX family)